MHHKMKATKRSKDEIAQDVAIVLQDRRLSPNAINAVIRNAIICWTEYDGKLVGCEYWSVGTANSKPEELEHEHVVPKRVIREMLYALDPPTKDAVHEVFEQYAIACVVTREEHRLLGKRFRATMPKEFKSTRNPFERYRQLGISVVRRNGEKVEVVV